MIGLPLPATEISIRSLDDPTQEMPRGESGEICIAGPQVMSGYWNKPQDTEKTFVGRFLRTGDVGYMDEDGYIFIVDRIKDMINASGFKIYPRRIEDALYQHHAVAEVTVRKDDGAFHRAGLRDQAIGLRWNFENRRSGLTAGWRSLRQ